MGRPTSNDNEVKDETPYTDPGRPGISKGKCTYIYGIMSRMSWISQTRVSREDSNANLKVWDTALNIWQSKRPIIETEK